MHFESAPMIALLEAKAACLWSRMHSPGSLPRGVVVYATVILSEVRPNVLHKLERAGVIRQLGSDNTTATLALAIEAVKETWIRIGKSCKSTAL